MDQRQQRIIEPVRGWHRRGALVGRIVEPVWGWETFEGPDWDDSDTQVEGWFDGGEALRHADTSVHEIRIDEPGRLERVLAWLRRLLG